MSHDVHLRKKAIKLRTEQKMTLEQIVELLQLPKTTIYGWIKDIPIPRTRKETDRQRAMSEKMVAKYKALRDEAYQQGCEEAAHLMQNPLFRDFVVLYMAEGSRKNRNAVEFVNSDARMVKLVHDWMLKLTTKKISYRIQYHVDHDEQALKEYWGHMLGISAEIITTMRKSNSGQLDKRNFRSQFGLLSIKTGDTYFRSRLQSWMDFVKQQW